MTLPTMHGEHSFQYALAGRSAPLTPEEERELARRFRDHSDRRAAERLTRAHLRLVVFLATKHRHYGVSVSELIAEGKPALSRTQRGSPTQQARSTPVRACLLRTGKCRLNGIRGLH
jgi:RNA polymerase sigma-32 factor